LAQCIFVFSLNFYQFIYENKQTNTIIKTSDYKDVNAVLKKNSLTFSFTLGPKKVNF